MVMSIRPLCAYVKYIDAPAPLPSTRYVGLRYTARKRPFTMLSFAWKGHLMATFTLDIFAHFQEIKANLEQFGKVTFPLSLIYVMAPFPILMNAYCMSPFYNYIWKCLKAHIYQKTKGPIGDL